MRVALALALLLGIAGSARAQDLRDRFNISLYLTGMYDTESQGPPADLATSMKNPQAANQAATFNLGYGDLRAVIDGRRLPGNFELHLDGRVRLTGDYSIDAGYVNATQITARGYLGGREYQLYQAYAKRKGESWDFALGRLVVNESDGLRIDGARLWWRFRDHWDASVFAGSYPDPFSRSLTTDYDGGGAAFAGGADTTYTYDRVWGAISAVGAYLGGPTVKPFDPNNATAPATGGASTRAYVTWTDFWRLVDWIDLYNDVVFDITGDAGPQLTRLDLLATGRIGKHFSLHLGYDHLSALAIDMYLSRLLNSRPEYVTGSIENNLTIERTARDQGRVEADVQLGKLTIYGEGRLRHRSLFNPQEDLQFLLNGQTLEPTLAYDATVGARDEGSLAGIRAGLWGTYVSDYLATSYIAALEVGRGFFSDKLAFETELLYAKTTDAAYAPMPPACNAGLPVAMMGMNTLNSLAPGCYGARSGNQYELGLTVSGAPFAHWYALLDYRLVADTASGPAAAILTNRILLRVEAHY